MQERYQLRTIFFCTTTQVPSALYGAAWTQAIHPPFMGLRGPKRFKMQTQEKKVKKKKVKKTTCEPDMTQCNLTLALREHNT
jgi:hypothetical protein